MNPFFKYRFRLDRDSSTDDVLLVFCGISKFDSEAFATLIEQELEDNLLPDELLLVLRETSFDETVKALGDDSVNVATLARLSNRVTITLIGYDISGSESRRTWIRGEGAKPTIKLEHFKRRAMTHIFMTRRGFVESTPTYHFENPSGRHTERFIRLWNVLVRGAEIAFIGFCTLPYIPMETQIAYLDTPSLYAVVSAVNEQRAALSDASPIIADNFSSYAGSSSYSFNRISNSVVLISASSSGSLASKLARDFGFESSQLIHILFLGKDSSHSRIVCDLRRDSVNTEGVPASPRVEEAKDCKMCARGSHAIKLQGDQFEFAGPQQEPILIAKADAPSGLSGVMSRLGGGDILEIGLGKASSREPRQFSINASRVLLHQPFYDRLDYMLRRSAPASTRYIIAIDESSKALAQKIAAHTGSAQVIARDDVDSIDPSTTSAIVIAALVVESGRCLLDISRDLRSIVPKAPLLYIVGVSKTTGEARREMLERTLIETSNPYRYQYVEIERVLLPFSDENNAWSAERKLLSNLTAKGLVPAEVRAEVKFRLDRLRKAAEPMLDDLFVSNSNDQKLHLQPGFVFWSAGMPERHHSQADVYYTVASVLQQLRTSNQARAIKSNWFQQTILAAGNFGRFNDDIIQASILRAASPFEMNFAEEPTESRELGRLIRNVIDASDRSRGGAAAEFLLALATNRLRLCQVDLENVLNRGTVGIGMVDLLLDVCRRELPPPQK